MLEIIKIITKSWQNGLFYSKFMTIFWFIIPFLTLLFTHYIEKESNIKKTSK